LVHYDAADSKVAPAVPFVRCEAFLSEQIWNPKPGDRWLQELPLSDLRWPPADSNQPPVDGLVGIGHGLLPADRNWNHSGLLVPGKDGEMRLLTATELNGILHVRHLLLSACLLGGTQECLGEPLGLFAAVFEEGSSTHTAIGAALPVGDLECCLISLAIQFRLCKLKTTPAGADAAASWIDVFADVQRDLTQGRWPSEFSAWLKKALPRALTHEQVLAPSTRTHWRQVVTTVSAALGLSATELETEEGWRRAVQQLATSLAQRVPPSVRDEVHRFIAFGE
jgi:hypothetical protein